MNATKCEKCGYEGGAYWGCFGCEQRENLKAIARAEHRHSAPCLAGYSDVECSICFPDKRTPRFTEQQYA